MTLKDVDKLPIQKIWVADEVAELAQFDVVDKADIDKAEIVDAEMELIDKDALKAILRNIIDDYAKSSNDDVARMRDAFIISLQIIDTLNTVAAEPIIHACWEPGFKHHSVVHCSNCEYEPPELSTHYDLYDNSYAEEEFTRCPRCGAIMDKKINKD